MSWYAVARNTYLYAHAFLIFPVIQENQFIGSRSLENSLHFSQNFIEIDLLGRELWLFKDA